ncbi:methylmalonyl-CoA epimerase [Bacillus inaquosorum]|uniref:methylmalonyl-CoA epimerase n=1 Tax=Bacillus inaquosorum TaxID=483913 RepID=UPI0022803068|nr:methylmalonyl-CoA epimerase [Bacillus inaquosorum]MCY9042399.1 methylmalonyl-CoA epimerase [Bacillus inaquosorum]MCY9101754.1 methylmalonyl-CoA epimerase [Bacillus inaquosorum]MCY9123754.1 methylmalonyl-CoA epimerase [Bacillus inaquosorum]
MNRLDHIGIAVFSIEEARSFYEDILGLAFLHQETVEEQKVNVAFFQAGSVKLELIEPLTPDSPVRLFLEKKGQGLHHVAFLCTGLSEQLQALSDRQVQLIDKYPRQGANGKKIAFLSPRETNGILVELCEQKGVQTVEHE